MGKQPFISHAVNGYSRYDVPESKAFSCTPGILYPVRIDFINARDRISIAQGVDIRSNPLAVPSFNPYTVRLHRFWVPMQLYHPEMRTNSSKFDMNNVTLNWLPISRTPEKSGPLGFFGTTYQNSLLSWLRLTNQRIDLGTFEGNQEVQLPTVIQESAWCIADTYLAYWDIVRNYYSYSQWGLYSIAWPGSWYALSTDTGSGLTQIFTFNKTRSLFTQRYLDLSFLDAYFESQFYPSAVASPDGTINRSNLFSQILRSDTFDDAQEKDPYDIPNLGPGSFTFSGKVPKSQFDTTGSDTPAVTGYDLFTIAHPMAVIPSNPDRFSRLIPFTSSSDVNISNVSTIPQLAIASRLQEYKDLLGAGGSRYSDWLETFFASRIEHVDRPKLLFSASQTVNVQVIMNQGGTNNFIAGSGSCPLGQQGGAIAFNTQLGRRQSYYFREPGYMIDMLSIRPVYYWSGVRPDYLNYRGADYFNPIYNDIGYQDVPRFRLGGSLRASDSLRVVAQEPCFNEFRSSYDEALGALSAVFGVTSPQSNGVPLYAYWVQQRHFDTSVNASDAFQYYKMLFVDISTVNSPFLSNVEDNLFVNMSYSVQKKNLVNKTFATRLSNR